jgi:hypothetical protein
MRTWRCRSHSLTHASVDATCSATHGGATRNLPYVCARRYVMQHVGKMWPRVSVHWHDRYSDRAIELLAFNGLGQVGAFAS